MSTEGLSAQPFQAGTTAVTCDAILNRPPADLAALKPDLPPAFARIVAKALEKDRRQRYQSAADMRGALEAVKRAGESSAQDEITQAIAAALRIKLAPDAALLRRHAPNLRAYEAYLKARHDCFKATPESLAWVKAYGAPTGLAVFHALCGEFDRAAEWTARAIDERYPPLVATLGPLLRSSPGWPALAKLMNLPG